MHKKVTLADHEDYKITYYRAAECTDCLVVTFGYVGTAIADEGFGTKFLLQHGYNHIYVAQRKGTNYQELSVEKFHHFVAPIALNYSKVFTYGHSLGGYCALLYGGSINATAIAFVPRNPSHPSQNLKGKYPVFQHPELQFSSISNNPPIVIYDPLNKLDSSYVKDYVLPAYPDIRKVEVLNLGHRGAPKNFIRSGILKSFLLSILERDELIEVRLNFDKHPDYNFNLAKSFFNKKDYGKCFLFLRKSLQIEPTLKAVSLLRELRQKSDQVACLKFDAPDFFLDKLLRRVDSSKATSDFFYDLSEMFADVCDYSSARKMIEYAMVAQPNRVKFQKRLNLYDKFLELSSVREQAEL